MQIPTQNLILFTDTETDTEEELAWILDCVPSVTLIRGSIRRGVEPQEPTTLKTRTTVAHELRQREL